MTIYYVNASTAQTIATDGLSWANAYNNLQYVLQNLAGNGDEVWVAAGTYKPTTDSNRTATFAIDTGLSIYGGFAGTETALSERDFSTNLTILSGELGDAGSIDDNSHHVVTANSMSALVRLDGVIIQDGNTEGATSLDGAGITNSGWLTLQNVIIQNNTSIDDGGGISNNGTLTIFNSTVANNTANATSSIRSGGGGLINTTSGTVTIISSTFSGNSSLKNGGAIRNDGTLTMVGSTLSGNTAVESGGGLINTVDSGGSPASATITASTITNNVAQNLSSSVNLSLGGGGGIANVGAIAIADSIIAANLGLDIQDNFDAGVFNNGVPTGFATLTVFPLLFGFIPTTLTSNGHNVVGDVSHLSTGSFNGTNDQTDISDPGLAPLADNGGFTQTHALTATSTALDAGSGAIALSLSESTLGVDLNRDGDIADTFSTVGALAFDQRGSGYSRVQDDPNDVDTDATIDIGAFELQECFLTGTLILTETGEKPVEELERGDRVLTFSGQLEPIKWIGRQTYHRHTAHPLRSNPIQIKPGALGDHLPRRDLYVSPDHALLVDGLLINAGALTNGTSIVQIQPEDDTFTYYHIELEHHDLLLAEGCAAESYLPQKQNRQTFDNGDEYKVLYPAQTILSLLPMNYPRVSSKRQLPRFVAKRLAEVARSRYPHLVAGCYA